MNLIYIIEKMKLQKNSYIYSTVCSILKVAYLTLYIYTPTTRVKVYVVDEQRARRAHANKKD